MLSEDEKRGLDRKNAETAETDECSSGNRSNLFH